MRELNLHEMEWVSGGVEPSDDGRPVVFLDGAVQDAGEITVSANKPFITFTVPQAPVVSINIDAPPSISSNVKINFNLSALGGAGVPPVSNAGENEVGGLNSLSHR